MAVLQQSLFPTNTSQKKCKTAEIIKHKTTELLELVAVPVDENHDDFFSEVLLNIVEKRIKERTNGCSRGEYLYLQ